jgi:hypothetical protein
MARREMGAATGDESALRIVQRNLSPKKPPQKVCDAATAGAVPPLVTG